MTHHLTANFFRNFATDSCSPSQIDISSSSCAITVTESFKKIARQILSGEVFQNLSFDALSPHNWERMEILIQQDKEYPWLLLHPNRNRLCDCYCRHMAWCLGKVSKPNFFVLKKFGVGKTECFCSERDSFDLRKSSVCIWKKRHFREQQLEQIDLQQIQNRFPTLKYSETGLEN